MINIKLYILLSSFILLNPTVIFTQERLNCLLLKKAVFLEEFQNHILLNKEIINIECSPKKLLVKEINLPELTCDTLINNADGDSLYIYRSKEMANTKNQMVYSLQSSYHLNEIQINDRNAFVNFYYYPQWKIVRDDNTYYFMSQILYLEIEVNFRLRHNGKKIRIIKSKIDDSQIVDMEKAPIINEEEIFAIYEQVFIESKYIPFLK